jgi:hypothetical protein
VKCSAFHILRGRALGASIHTGDMSIAAELSSRVLGHDAPLSTDDAKAQLGLHYQELFSWLKVCVCMCI